MLLRQPRITLQRAAFRNASTTSEAANAAKEKASQASSKASEGLSRVTSSASSAITKVGSAAGNAVGKIGGRTGRLIGRVSGERVLATIQTSDNSISFTAARFIKLRLQIGIEYHKSISEMNVLTRLWIIEQLG